jgi:hypothetical protein
MCNSCESHLKIQLTAVQHCELSRLRDKLAFERTPPFPYRFMKPWPSPIPTSPSSSSHKRQWRCITIRLVLGSLGGQTVRVLGNFEVLCSNQTREAVQAAGACDIAGAGRELRGRTGPMVTTQAGKGARLFSIGEDHLPVTFQPVSC